MYLMIHYPQCAIDTRTERFIDDYQLSELK